MHLLNYREIINSSKRFYQLKKINESYKFFEKLLRTRNKYLVFEWTSNKKKIMYSSNDFQKEIIICIKNFYQRNDNSIKSFVSFEIFDASNMIIDE